MMEERLARLEATIADLRVSSGRMEEMLSDIKHWMHNGGNPVAVEGRVRRLEQWRAFLVGAGALASVIMTAAIVLVATLR